ncbi:hypothetical protein CLV42_1017 [Chitinophaga ginsengisoli]|uniref:Uncharacterized protein n=1 Tax=Chitinophaga ginsengisoli TaxID=363837 RepID=A0A2P8GMQ6_9BACT|nr:hypothetical protein CLV42_1017 [Chitinophaga ginsengisoli]
MIISIERFLLSPNNLVDYIHPPILAVCIKGCYIPIKKYEVYNAILTSFSS